MKYFSLTRTIFCGLKPKIEIDCRGFWRYTRVFGGCGRIRLSQLHEAGKKMMIDFLNFIGDHTIIPFVMVIVSFSFTLLLLYLRLYKYALLFALLFLAALSLNLKGPMGQHFIKKFNRNTHPMDQHPIPNNSILPFDTALRGPTGGKGKSASKNSK